jgi:hypothetical protein
MRWLAGLQYAPRGDEEACGGPREGHITAEDSARYQSERLRRDVTCEHAALQQREASAAPLDEAARVCLLMHVGVAQASTPLQQEGPLVSSVLKVRVGCRRRGM